MTTGFDFTWANMLTSLLVRLIILSGFFPSKIFSNPTDDFQYRDGRLFSGKVDYPSMDYSNSILTREIKIKQGRLKGVVRELKNKNLKNVEVYLGIPYAAAPVGGLRFMPPGSPPTWRNLRTFDTFGPVCPQTPPDLSHEPHKNMNAGRFNHLKSLLPFLGNQSEDCLYLNIYAPFQGTRVVHKYPVIVYIHGESFEWNSGNPYDGSVLASYGNVIVVTINFRLGILGFLKPGISGPTVSNFGLLDQIAALQWVKENIGEFGGDPSSVTLMGHGTGAACINFLMVSPVSMASDGLFHKAILMSGTALSDWALTVNPLQFTIQVAEALNCPLIEENDELSNCLRKKRLSEIMSVRLTVPEFQTPFGPVIDGSVVPNTPDQVMGIYQDLFTRYDLLYGMTEWESYHLLNAISLTFGMLERERDQLLRQYMHSKFEVLPDFALATTLNEYLYWRKPLQGNQPAAMEHLHLVLDLLSDARVISPMVQMGLYHAKINPKSYMYIFRHKSKFGEFAGSERSISGEEIPYVFGAPLLNGVGSLSHYRFSLSEQLLSEFILTYFTNFAKTGNPNAPRRSAYLIQGPREWQQFDVDWPEFDVKNQSFLSLGIPPQVDHQYRSPMTQFWNEELPNLLRNPTSIANKIKYPKPSVKQTYQPEGRYDPWETLPRENLPQEKYSTDSTVPREKQSRTNPTSHVYGTIRTSPVERPYLNNPFRTDEKERITSGQSDHPAETSTENAIVPAGSGNSMALTFFLIIGAAFLIINVFIFTLLYYKKKRLHIEERRLNSAGGEALDERTYDGSHTGDRGCNMRIYDIVAKKRDEDYEAIKLRKKEELRKCSTSTVDPQSRVREWIQQGILHKYTPGFYRGKQYRDESSENDEPRGPMKPILKQSGESERKRTTEKNVQKVSVAIDATPSTRGSSVLKQTPIEITKSLDRGLIAAGSEGEDRYPDDDKSLRKSRTSVSLQMLPLESEGNDPVIPQESTIVKIHHFHSKSDPNENCLQTFASKNSEDVNVTSREEPEEPDPKSEEVTLRNIQRRNFPKVLPDLPVDLKRLSLPSSAHFQSFYSQKGKVPPPPPPRVSTLDRKRRDWTTDEPKTMTSSASISFKKPEESQRQEKKKPKAIIAATNSSAGKPEPSIIIQPVIGPKSAKTKSTPYVNLCNKDPMGHVKGVKSETKSNDSSDTEESSKSTATVRRTQNKI